MLESKNKFKAMRSKSLQADMIKIRFVVILRLLKFKKLILKKSSSKTDKSQIDKPNSKPKSFILTGERILIQVL